MSDYTFKNVYTTDLILLRYAKSEVDNHEFTYADDNLDVEMLTYNFNDYPPRVYNSTIV